MVRCTAPPEIREAPRGSPRRALRWRGVVFSLRLQTGLRFLLSGTLDQIDYEAFGARQRVTWDAIRVAGPAIEEQVLRALRDPLPPARTLPETA